MCVLCVGMADGDGERLLELERTAIRSEQRELLTRISPFSACSPRNAEEEMKEAQRQMARKTEQGRGTRPPQGARQTRLEERHVASLESEHAKTCAGMRHAHDLKLAAKNRALKN